MGTFTKTCRFAALFAVMATTMSLTSCSKFDDSDLWKKIDELSADQKVIKGKIELLEALNNKLFIEKMTQKADKSGWDLLMSDGTTISVVNGQDGATGAPGATGNTGADGAPGEPGIPGTNLSIKEVKQSSNTLFINLPDFTQSNRWNITDRFDDVAGAVRKITVDNREIVAIYGGAMGNVDKTPKYIIPTLNNDLTKDYFVFSTITFIYNDGSKPITFDVAAVSADAPYGKLTNVLRPNDNLVKVDPITAVVDKEGNSYKVVEINGLYWMAENFKCTQFNDGTAITTGLAQADWKVATTPAYCIWGKNTGEDGTPEEMAARKAAIGCLYNFFAATAPNIAPEGWRLPTVAECQALVDTYNVNNAHWGLFSTTLLPAIGGWKDDPGFIDPTNTSGFSALCGGIRDWNGYPFLGWTFKSYFWTSGAVTEPNGEGKMVANALNLEGSDGRARVDSGVLQVNGCSIRFVKE